MKIASRSRSSRPGQYPVATIAAFQAPMPAQQRRWRDDERLPTGARQKSAGGAEKQAVNRGDRRPPRAPAKDCEFVPQYDDLEVLNSADRTRRTTNSSSQRSNTLHNDTIRGLLRSRAMAQF